MINADQQSKIRENNHRRRYNYAKIFAKLTYFENSSNHSKYCFNINSIPIIGQSEMYLNVRHLSTSVRNGYQTTFTIVIGHEITAKRTFIWS